VKRLRGLIPAERILVVTTSGQAGILQEQASQIPFDNYILEPEPRGTAAVVGLAAKVLENRDPQAVMMVLPSDHFINNLKQFHKIMRTAIQVANFNLLVTLGIEPTAPSTGYGYIQQAEAVDGKFDFPVYKVRCFKEKPEEADARRMLASGDHTWNSGMFIWKVDVILTAIRKLMPELGDALERIGKAWGNADHEAVLASVWLPLLVETIDYGVMERADNVAVLPAGGLGWNDVGSWDALFDVLPADENGNVVNGADHLAIDTSTSYIQAGDQKLIVTIGVDNLVVVDSGDALLICKRGHTQQVRKALEQMKKTKQERYL
jgi:mannose-1-phosphate guanylyltransferase